MVPAGVEPTFFLLIREQTPGEQAKPVFASSDPELVRQVGRLIARRLGARTETPLRGLFGPADEADGRQGGR